MMIDRERIIDWIAIAFAAVVVGGFVIYLAHLYATTPGGHW